MKRRNFIKTAASSFILPVVLDGLGIKAYDNESILVKSLLGTNALAQDRVLVMINMNGGNDGLNTVIPLDQYSAYTNLRANIAIPQNKILALNGTAATGLHPSMAGFQELYNTNKLAIIHSVAYPNQNLSHYRSNEIWMTATDSTVYGTTGWLGRYLDNRYPNYPSSYPNSIIEDPLALQIGYLTSTVLAGPQSSMAVALSTPEEFSELIGEGSINPPSDLPCCNAGDLITYIRKQQVLSVGYAAEIKAAAQAGTTLATYPSNNSVADQLKIVARLIHGGLKTKIFLVTQNGYDTHSEQISSNGTTTTGNHANLLKTLSDAVLAFQKDLVLQGIEDKVIGMTYSEFGRRANSNNSGGTDHGVAAPLFVFGKNVKQKMIGTNPNLSDLTINSGQYDLKMQVDFRRVYRDILQDWFGLNQNSATSLIYQNFQTTSVLNDYLVSIKTGNWTAASTWSAGRIPTSNDKVLVQSGHNVSINSGETGTCRFIDIQGGFYTAPGVVFKTTG